MTSSTKRPSRRNFVVAIVASSFILSFPYLYLRANGSIQRPLFRLRSPQLLSTAEVHRTQEQVSLSSTAPSTPNAACNQRLGNDYIENFVATATNYCDSGSTSKLVCFHNNIFQKTDSFCIGDGGLLDTKTQRLNLDCDLRALSADEVSRGVPSFKWFPDYWYETGPRYIFSRFFDFKSSRQSKRRKQDARGVKILVKRESNHDNIWHTMMEIMALSLSLEVLGQARDPSTGIPVWTNADAKNAQIVFLDDLPQGPYYDLWEMFTGVSPSRLADLATHPSPSSSDSDIDSEDMRVIVPLPGSANPFWQGQWADMHCGPSPLLEAFSRRVLDHYNITTVTKPSAAPPKSRRVLTVVDRSITRRLVSQDAYITELRQKHPDLEIQLIDFGTLSLQQQIEIAHSTDILVGPHGAGLTHAFFLPKGSTVVEISPPGTDIRTFDLVSQALGHRYLQKFGRDGYQNQNSTGNWQHDDIFIEGDCFMEVVEEAIAGALM